jgi:hypothetical protein
MDDDVTLSREEQESMKTPVAASMLVKKRMQAAAEQTRKFIAMAEDLRAKIGNAQFLETYPDVALQAEEMREWLVSYEASQSRVADN